MARKTQTTANDSTDHCEQSRGQGVWPLPEKMTRSVIFRRLPMTTRMKLDAALLLRGERGQTLEALASAFKLKENYRIGVGALRTYAAGLEDAIRPVATSLVISGLLGCLSAEQRSRLTEGSQILFLSRVIQVMDAPTTHLSVADLGRLATVFKSSAGQRDGASRKSASGSQSRAGEPEVAVAPSDEGLDQVEEAVRMLYGLDQPRNR